MKAPEFAMTEPILSDADARDAIARDLDTNLVVEAAAGTGKTTALVARLLNDMRRGCLSGHRRLAAVTFTTKAASELRTRLEAALDREIAHGDVSPDERRNLEDARANLPECHIGTIHSFCARILRERPVEAGVTPNFTELDDEQDSLYRRRAWDRFTRDMAAGDHRRLYAIFRTFGLDNETLGAGFLKYADFPDVSHWPGRDAHPDHIDTARFLDGVADYHRSITRFRPLLDEAECESDRLIPLMQVLDRRFLRMSLPLDLSSAHRLARLFPEKPLFRKTQWNAIGLDPDDAEAEKLAYDRFWQECVKPFRADCLAAVYAAALEAYAETVLIYDRLRRTDGVLNFNDLLLGTARLLREFPEVRADLADRYAKLLVDEVQDTDPVQAEIMFLLASRDATARDWRHCPPRPGALFIVGDPKQSIYRFRRADIVVYQELKTRIARNGGRVLHLTNNFRSAPSVIDWVNATFSARPDDNPAPEAMAACGRFAPGESEYSPAYVPLVAARPAAPDACFHGVYRLETLAVDKKTGRGEKDIVRDEAARIANFIRHAVDTGLPIPDRNGSRPATAGDFLIVTYRTASAAAYGQAVRNRGLACIVSSGGILANSPVLELLQSYLDALANPDNAILLLAVLRGGLFGYSDVDLFNWKTAGGVFDLMREPAAIEDPDISAAILTMRRHGRLFQDEPPVWALRRVADDLGLWPLSLLGNDPAVGAGVLESALQLLEKESPAIPTLGALAERLAWHRENAEDEPLAAREPPASAVRVMNLHKTKGLEAPVVFLTSTRRVKNHPADFSVRRRDGKAIGGMRLTAGEHDNIHLAEPRAWPDLAREEELFLAAEKTRLNYVAATRAGAALVVSVHKDKNKAWKSEFLPPGTVIAETLPEPPFTAAQDADLLTEIDADALDAAAAYRKRSLPRLTDGSYASVRVTRAAATDTDASVSATASKPKAAAKKSRPKKSGAGEDQGLLFTPEMLVSARALPADNAGAASRATGAAGSRSGETGTVPAPPTAPPADSAVDAVEEALGFGDVLHRLLEAAGSGGDGDLQAMAAELLREHDLPEERLDEALVLVRSVVASDLWQRAAAADQVFREAPFAVREDRDGVPTVLHGIIDLVFREEDGWVVVEYKSDRLRSVTPLAAARRHQAQLDAYAAAWERSRGEPVKEKGVFFAREGKYVQI
ncbi:MAG: UvrD-helicase domain-containing protein [Planctomycetes bacterium]|nr:UvrD-helicase domain-containing protein [Planctomycetota bacterium]